MLLKHFFPLLSSSTVPVGKVGLYFRITAVVIIVRHIEVMRHFRFKRMADKICKIKFIYNQEGTAKLYKAYYCNTIALKIITALY